MRLFIKQTFTFFILLLCAVSASHSINSNYIYIILWNLWWHSKVHIFICILLFHIFPLQRGSEKSCCKMGTKIRIPLQNVGKCIDRHFGSVHLPHIRTQRDQRRSQLSKIRFYRFEFGRICRFRTDGTTLSARGLRYTATSRQFHAKGHH